MALLAVCSGTGPIPAPVGTDTITEAAGAGTVISLVLLLVWTVWSVRTIVRKKLWMLAMPSGMETPRIEPHVFIFAGVSVWLGGMFAGTVVYLILYGPDAAGDSLGSSALLGSASQIGSALVALAMFAALPALARRGTGIGALFERSALRVGVFAFALVCPLALVAALGAQQAAILVAKLLETAPPDRLAHGTLRQLADPGMMSSPAWWITIAVVTIGAPLMEEIVFRGFVQTGIARLAGSHTIGIFVTTILFVLVHVGIADWQAMLPLAVLSLGLGYAYARTGTIWVPVVMHSLFNMLNIGMALAG